jgi:hypothetical protein
LDRYDGLERYDRLDGNMSFKGTDAQSSRLKAQGSKFKKTKGSLRPVGELGSFLSLKKLCFFQTFPFSFEL